MAIRRYWGIALALWMCACSPQARHTVQEYRADAALREATLRACATDKVTPDCVNAQAAESLAGHGERLRDLPPLNLDPAKNPLAGPARKPGSKPSPSPSP